MIVFLSHTDLFPLRPRLYASARYKRNACCSTCSTARRDPGACPPANRNRGSMSYFRPLLTISPFSPSFPLLSVLNQPPFKNQFRIRQKGPPPLNRLILATTKTNTHVTRKISAIIKVMLFFSFTYNFLLWPGIFRSVVVYGIYGSAPRHRVFFNCTQVFLFHLCLTPKQLLPFLPQGPGRVRPLQPGPAAGPAGEPLPRPRLDLQRQRHQHHRPATEDWLWVVCVGVDLNLERGPKFHPKQGARPKRLFRVFFQQCWGMIVVFSPQS